MFDNKWVKENVICWAFASRKKCCKSFWCDMKRVKGKINDMIRKTSVKASNITLEVPTGLWFFHLEQVVQIDILTQPKNEMLLFRIFPFLHGY